MMRGGMQFPPYLYELFKRVKSIVVPEFFPYDFFYVNLVLFQVWLQTQPLPVPGQLLYFLKLWHNFCRLGITYINSYNIKNFLVQFQVRLQTQPLPAAGEKPMYSGAMDCVKKTIAKEGPKGLYKGKNKRVLYCEILIPWS